MPMTRFFAIFKITEQSRAPKSEASSEARREKIARDLVARYAQGSPSLQLGMFVTQDEVDRRAKNILNHKFS